jgi:hypothetical protein
MGGGEGSPAGRNSGVGALVVDEGGAPVVPGGEENADTMQRGSASSKTWSASLISLCAEVEERLEDARAPVTFGTRCLAWSAARFGRGGISEDAPEYREDKESERRRRDHLQASELSTHSGGTCGPPMRNQSSLAAQSAAERRGKRREGRGVLIAGVLMAI